MPLCRISTVQVSFGFKVNVKRSCYVWRDIVYILTVVPYKFSCCFSSHDRIIPFFNLVSDQILDNFVNIINFFFFYLYFDLLKAILLIFIFVKFFGTFFDFNCVWKWIIIAILSIIKRNVSFICIYSAQLRIKMLYYECYESCRAMYTEEDTSSFVFFIENCII